MLCFAHIKSMPESNRAIYSTITRFSSRPMDGSAGRSESGRQNFQADFDEPPAEGEAQTTGISWRFFPPMIVVEDCPCIISL
jgi:hypothetical protein